MNIDMTTERKVSDCASCTNDSRMKNVEKYVATTLTQKFKDIHIHDRNSNRYILDNQNVNCPTLQSLHDNAKWKKIEVQDLFKQPLNMKNYLSQANWVSNSELEIITKKEQFAQEFVKPIGISILPNNNLVIAERGYRNSVGIFDPLVGTFISKFKTKREFSNPSDIAVLLNGNIVVRDDIGLQMFDNNAEFLNDIIPQGIGKKKLNGVCYGVKCDPNGLVLTISTNPWGQNNCITRSGETDVLIIDTSKNVIVEKVELLDVIMNHKFSKCRFLECCQDKIFVSDLGLHHVYVIDRLNSSVLMIGNCGIGPGQFFEPAGLAVDSAGNLIVSDAGNNRLQLFDRNNIFLAYIGLNIVSRPSGILLDKRGESLYVLNLKGNFLTKLTLKSIPAL